MQASCPHCQNKIVIDDARVPDRPFSVKCPKCQQAVKFPGKSAAAAAAPAPAAEPPPPPPPSADEMRPGEPTHQGERALVALADRGQAGHMELMLTRQGYSVDTLADMDEAARLLEQGAYDVIVTAPVAGAGGKESLYQKACRVNPETRRRFFMVLVADGVKTGDGTQAFALQGELVVNVREVTNCGAAFRNTLAERGRVYTVYTEARKRADKEAGYI
jgi:predicted Zn finger-like uncharacterized protein